MDDLFIELRPPLLSMADVRGARQDVCREKWRRRWVGDLEVFVQWGWGPRGFGAVGSPLEEERRQRRKKGHYGLKFFIMACPNFHIFAVTYFEGETLHWHVSKKSFL